MAKLFLTLPQPGADAGALGGLLFVGTEVAVVIGVTAPAAWLGARQARGWRSAGLAAAGFAIFMAASVLADPRSPAWADGAAARLACAVLACAGAAALARYTAPDRR